MNRPRDPAHRMRLAKILCKYQTRARTAASAARKRQKTKKMLLRGGPLGGASRALCARDALMEDGVRLAHVMLWWSITFALRT